MCQSYHPNIYKTILLEKQESYEESWSYQCWMILLRMMDGHHMKNLVVTSSITVDDTNDRDISSQWLDTLVHQVIFRWLHIPIDPHGLVLIDKLSECTDGDMKNKMFWF